MGQEDIIGCFIPECFNTSEDPPGKRFVRVPCLPKLRQLWIKAGLRLKVKVPLVDKSPMFCCEDHFNLHSDATKQWLSSSDLTERGNFIKLKRGVLPHIFPSKSKEYVKTYRKKTIRRRISTNGHENLKRELEQRLDLIDLTDSHESTSLDTSMNKSQDQLENIKTSENSNQNETVEQQPKENNCDKEQENETDKDISRIEIIPDCKSKKDITRNISPVKNGRRSSDRSQNSRDIVEEELENTKENYEVEENTVIGIDLEVEDDKEITLTSENKDDELTKEEVNNVSPVDSPVKKNQMRRKRKIKKTNEKPRLKPVPQQLRDEDQEFLFKEQVNEDQIETDENKSKKKRTVVKEILAWIPTNTSNLPGANSMQQPFLMLPTSNFPALGVSGLPPIPFPISAENDPQYVISSTGRSSPQVQNEEHRVVNCKEITTEIRSLKETMESLNKELTLLRSDNVTLKEQNIEIIKNRKEEGIKYDELTRLEIVAETLSSCFTPNQVTLLLRKSANKGKIHWTNSEMDNAAKLFNISPQAYKYVLESMKYPFPCMRSVRNYAKKKANSGKVPPGRESTNYELFNDMEDSDEALVESMLEEYCSKEKLEQDSGASKHNQRKSTISMEEQDSGTVEVQETHIKVSKTDLKLGASNQPLKIPGRRKEDSQLTQDEMGTPPKIIRVPVQQNKGKLNLSEVLEANSEAIPHTLIPKIVKIGSSVNMRKTSSEFIKTNLKEFMRVRDEIDDSSIDESQEQTTAIERETVLKNTRDGPISYSVTLVDNSIEKQQEKKDYLADEVLNYNHESIAEEFIANHGYHENTDKHISQVIMHEGVNVENVPQIISAEDGSKVIRLQVNPMPGEDPTLYEEVVIHCDDPTMFDNEVVSLSFPHDDPMVENAFL